MKPNLKYLKNVDWKDRLFGVKCPNCSVRGAMHQAEYTRGWNNLCNQASGDTGLRCMSCSTIAFLTSFEESRRLTPAWCTVVPDTKNARWFPDFKHNRDTSHYKTHSSNQAEAK